MNVASGDSFECEVLFKLFFVDIVVHCVFVAKKSAARQTEIDYLVIFVVENQAYAIEK